MTRGGVAVAGAFVLAMGWGPPAPLAGEVPARPGGVVLGTAPLPDTVPTQTGSLEAASVDFARAFADGSAERLSALLVSDGVRLHLDGPGHPGLSARQAVATLREFLRRYEENEAVVTRAARVEGTPDRGFAELEWGARLPGTSQKVYYSLFLGLSRQSGDWRVDEVRLLR